MAQPIFSGKQLPKYHEGMLIVKLRSSSRLRSALAATNERESVLESSGMSALSTFERAGLIKQVIPLARPMQEESPIIGSTQARKLSRDRIQQLQQQIEAWQTLSREVGRE
jgi:hypothetical protein